MRHLDDLLVFAAVVDQGGFSKAAKAIGLPKSNVSRRVSRLEDDLGVKLLERTTRSQSLTEVGQAFYEHCVRVREELEAAENAVESLLAAPRGRLRFCASVSVGQGLIAPLLANFSAQYPDVTLDLHLTNRRVDLLEEGFDLAIRVGPLEDSSLVARRICSIATGLYASPDYNRRNGIPHSIEELQAHRCLYMNAASQQARWPLANTKSEFTAINASYTCDDFSVLCQMAVDGAGIALLPSYVVRGATLVPILDGVIGSTVEIFAVYPSHKGMTPKVRAFIDYLAGVT